MMPNPKFEAPSWDEVYSMMLKLAENVKQSHFEPEVIVGVSRGGWPPARIMSDLLENQNLANMKVVFYRDIGLRNKTPLITQPVSSNIKGKSVLVVDDVSDTGHSLRVVFAHLRAKGAKRVKVCTLYLKPGSVVIPQFYAKKTSRWIIFPWERLESILLLSRKLGEKRTNPPKIVRELKDSGADPALIRRLMVLASD